MARVRPEYFSKNTLPLSPDLTRSHRLQVPIWPAWVVPGAFPVLVVVVVVVVVGVVIVVGGLVGAGSPHASTQCDLPGLNPSELAVMDGF